MVVFWLGRLAMAAVGWLLDLLDFLPSLSLGSGVTFTAPVPMLGASGVGLLNDWFPVCVSVMTALAVGKALQWLYKQIPFLS